MEPLWIYLCVVAGTCLLSFGLYGWDKSSAMHRGTRVRESTLHLVNLLGGWPGGLIAGRMFRHKTRKWSFRVIFALTVAAHLVLSYGLWRGLNGQAG